MAKKTLLTEGEFKKFMKLARLEPLAAEKLAEMYSPGKDDDDDDDRPKKGMRPAVPAVRNEQEGLDEDLAALFEEDDEMRAGDDVPEPEETAMEPVDDEPMDMDVEMDDDMGGDETAELKARIESSLEDLMKGLDDLMGRAGAGDMMDVETDEEGDEGMGDIQGGDAEMDDVAPPAPMDDEGLTEAVARRVARRLQRESKVDAKSDLIAERIMKRLKNL